MDYKGYTAAITFDDDANLFHGEVVNLRDVITFQGRSVEELRTAFEESVEDYLEFCAERGEEPEKPLSGRFVVRVEPDLHRQAVVKAASKGMSLNAWVKTAIANAIGTRKASHGKRGKI